MYKQAPKSLAMKALVGNQKNLPAALKAQIEAAPGKMMDSPVKQTQSRDNYYDLKPKDAKTYADSAAVETRHAMREMGASRSRGLGEVAGKVASGGKFSQGNFTTGSTPNSSEAKEFLKGQRNTQTKYGMDYKDAYPKSPAKQTSAPELKTTTKKKGGLSKTALANAGRDMLKADYGIDNPNMSDKAIADSIKKYKRTDEVRSRVKQGLKKGDNEGEFKGSFGSPAQMKSPAKQAKENPISKAESFNMFRKNNQLDRNGRQQKTNYSKSYQNKKISNSSGGGSIGDTERDIVTKHQYNAVRGNAVKATAAKENKFGIKKPKVNIK